MQTEVSEPSSQVDALEGYNQAPSNKISLHGPPFKIAFVFSVKKKQATQRKRKTQNAKMIEAKRNEDTDGVRRQCSAMIIRPRSSEGSRRRYGKPTVVFALKEIRKNLPSTLACINAQSLR